MLNICQKIVITRNAKSEHMASQCPHVPFAYRNQTQFSFSCFYVRKYNQR